ncbi:MAG: type II secretion system protein [Verrucomicrobiota bacterium]
MRTLENRKSKIENIPALPPGGLGLRQSHGANRKSLAFTLIELLVVIAVIGILAAFIFPSLKGIKRTQYLRTAAGELEQIQAALDNYKAKYGFYPPGNPYNFLVSPLYYELAGVTNGGGAFVTLDGVSSMSAASVNQAYGVDGFVNCTRGSGEDAVLARNFLPDLKPNRIFYPVTNNTVPTTVLITSVRGPDAGYRPLGATDVNPFRYRYPGVQNPNSYDLWVQLVISGKTNLISNWSRQVQINSPLP